MTERFEIYIVYKRRYINTFPFLSFTPARKKLYLAVVMMCCSYCWIRNTYFLPYDEDIPTDVRLGDRRRSGPNRLPYYQWVPLILLVQALAFYFPYRVWTRLSRYSGLDLHSLIEAGQSFSVTDMNEIRDKTLMYMTMMTDRCVSRPSRSCGGGGGFMVHIPDYTIRAYQRSGDEWETTFLF